MISRRSLLVSGAALTAATLAARGATLRTTLTGSMEQGSLIVGQTESGALVAFDDKVLHVSPEGIFACGLDWNRTVPAHLSVQFTDGSSDPHEIVPVLRSYTTQRVNGLPPETVTPPPDVLERIHREAVLIGEARNKDSDAIWFVEPFDWPAPGIMSGSFGSQRIDNGTVMAPHMGVDTANVEGTPIHAPANGTVLISTTFISMVASFCSITAMACRPAICIRADEWCA